MKRPLVKPTAIVYCLFNKVTGKLYPGFHKTIEPLDRYITSSKNVELLEAHSRGEVVKFIIYQGDPSICITLENWLLKYAKNNLDFTNMFYNESTGGGVGCVKDFSNLTAEMKDSTLKIMLEIYNGEYNPEQEVASVNVHKRTVLDKVLGKIRAGKYLIGDRSVDEVFELPRSQVRFNQLDDNKVTGITECMIDTPITAREVINAVILLVMPDGSLSIIDGNHTIAAAKRAKWVTISVMYISFSEFNNDMANVVGIGLDMNVVKDLSTGLTALDCQQRIIESYLRMKAVLPSLAIESNEFRVNILLELDRWWSIQSIVKNLDVAIKRYDTDQASITHNFYIRTKRELSRAAALMELAHPDKAVVTITSAAAFNSGVGAIINKVCNGYNTIMKGGIIIISHANYYDYIRWTTNSLKLDNCIDWIGKDITYKVLNPFNGEDVGL